MVVALDSCCSCSKLVSHTYNVRIRKIMRETKNKFMKMTFVILSLFSIKNFCSDKKIAAMSTEQPVS